MARARAQWKVRMTSAAQMGRAHEQAAGARSSTGRRWRIIAAATATWIRVAPTARHAPSPLERARAPSPSRLTRTAENAREHQEGKGGYPVGPAGARPARPPAAARYRCKGESRDRAIPRRGWPRVWAPSSTTTNPRAAVASTRLCARCRSPRRRRASGPGSQGAQRGHQQGREQQHGVGEMGDHDRRREDEQPHRDGAQQHRHHQNPPRPAMAGFRAGGLAPVTAPGHRGDGQDQPAHQRGGPTGG